MNAEMTISVTGATVVISPPGVVRTDIGRRLAAPLISTDAHQVDLVHRGIHPDLIEVVPGKNKEKIGIDQIRDVIRRGQFSPVQGDRKVCLIPHGEALTPEAGNALLKVLEEPTPYIVFVILVRDPGDLIPTIRSRSRIVRVPPPAASVVSQLMEIGYSNVDARYLADALSEPEITALFLERAQDVSTRRAAARDQAQRATVNELCTVISGGDIFGREAGVALLSRIVDGDPAVLVTTARTLAARGREDAIAFLELELRVIFAALRIAAGIIPPYPDPDVTALARRFGVGRLTSIGRAVEEARRAVDGYTSVEPVVLWLFLTIAGVIDDG